MKKCLWILLILPFITNCAYMDGLKHKKDVAPIPAGEAPAAAKPSNTVSQQENAATVNAAKIITPAGR